MHLAESFECVWIRQQVNRGQRVSGVVNLGQPWLALVKRSDRKQSALLTVFGRLGRQVNRLGAPAANEPNERIDDLDDTVD